MCVPGSANRTLVPIKRPLPGVVILVHGVNSEGEWYINAEKGLTTGLNVRLGRADMLPNEYQRDNPRNLLKVTRSPVIRFYWGYRAPVSETSKRDSNGEIKLKYKIFMKRREEVRGEQPGTSAFNYFPYSFEHPETNTPGTYYWGGGPFQNGTTALNMSWYDGFNPKIAGFFDTSSPYVIKERDRPLNEAPKRTYYVNASQRLADLIDSIYNEYPGDTVTVVSHSQGTMVALLAMLLVKRVPDTLFLCNSPYSFDDKITDAIAYGDKSPTSGSRVRTFYNVLERFKQSQALASQKTTEEQLKGVGGWLLETEPQVLDGRSIAPNGEIDGPKSDVPPRPECPLDAGVMWTPSFPAEEPVPGVEDHHNHGRVFVYCCAHDRVMGSVPLQSIGWKGVSYRLPHPTEPRGTSMPFTDYAGVLYQRQFMRFHSAGSTPDGEDGPLTPRCPTDGAPFWIPPQPDKSLGLFNELAIATKDDRIFVNGPRVPEPASIELMKSFNQNFDDTQKISSDPDFKFSAEAIYEKRKWLTERDVTPYGKEQRQRVQSDDEIATEMASTDATPTNHSTIFSHKDGELVRRILSYDLPIGRADSFDDPEFWRSLVKRADWLNDKSDEAYKQGGDFVPKDPPSTVDPETRALAREELERSRRMYGLDRP